MPASENGKQSVDLLDLICDLIEQPSSHIGAGLLSARCAELGRLIAMGLVQPGAAPKTITCRACDHDHAATPEFDSAAKTYFHFCPVAGRVTIAPHDLKTFELRPRAFVDLLIAAFTVLPAIGRELVAGKVWHLGDAVVGGTSLTLIYACRIGTSESLGSLARAVAAVPVTEIGMIVTSSPLPDPELALPHRYRMIGLRDIATAHQGRLAVRRDRLAAHVRMMRSVSTRPRAGAGRPSEINLIGAAYDLRRQNGKPFVSISAEARTILAGLSAAHPDRVPPAVATIRGHVSKFRSPKT